MRTVTYVVLAEYALLGLLVVHHLLELRQIATAHREALREDLARQDAVLVARREALHLQNARYAAVLKDLGLKVVAPKPRVEAWLYPVDGGSQVRWRVRASCVEEAAEIVSLSPLFRPETEDAA